MFKMPRTQSLSGFITLSFSTTNFRRGLDFFDLLEDVYMASKPEEFGEGYEQQDEREDRTDDGGSGEIVPFSMVLKEQDLNHARHQDNGAGACGNSADTELISVLICPKPAEKGPFFAHVFTGHHEDA